MDVTAIMSGAFATGIVVAFGGYVIAMIRKERLDRSTLGASGE